MPAARAEWMNSSTSQRITLSEGYGMEGARLYSMQQGWTPLLDGTPRSIPQGPDQVYRSADRLIHVIEAKGGTSPLGHAYGHPQGSTEWAVRSAERVLRSPASTEVERIAMREVVQAAAEGRLRVHVVRTPHVLGLPGNPVLQQTLGHSDEAARIADDVLRSIPSRSGNGAGRAVLAETDDAARAGATATDEMARAAVNQADDAVRGGATAAASTASATVLKMVGKAALVVGIAVDAGLRINDTANTEAAFREGRIDQREREVQHAGNIAGVAGGWAGAWVGTELGAMGGGAVGTLCGGVGAPIGGIVGGIVGGVAGYLGGEKVAKAGAEWTIKQIHAAGTTVKDAAAAGWEVTKEASVVVAEHTAQAAEVVATGTVVAATWVADQSVTGAKAVANGTVVAAEWVAEQSVRAAKAVAQGSEVVARATARAAAATWEGTKEAASWTANAASYYGSATASAAAAAWAWASDW